MSGHKVYGPKGIGALYIKSGTKIESVMFGGSQEYGKRPGTQNTTGIIGMAKAYELLGPLELRQKNLEKISKLKNLIIEKFLKIPSVELNGPNGEDRIANNVNILVKDKDQELIMAKLDLAGLAVSTGSACVSGSTTPSHVIKALGKATLQTSSIIRLTLGNLTTLAEAKKAISILERILAD